MRLKIKDMREDNDKTQTQISEYLLCDQSLYSKYERREREIPLSLIMKLAKYYNTSIDYLVGLVDEERAGKVYQQLKDLRIKNNLLESDIAKMLGISQEDYLKYETGENDIPTQILIKLADFYKTSTDYILGRTNNPKPPPT